MGQLLDAVLSLPTVIFAGMGALSLLYWGLVIVGAADLNPFDGAEGAVKGGVEGAVKGGAEALKAVTGGEAADAAGAVKGAAGAADVLGFLGLRKVPITISFSLFSIFGFAISYFTRYALDFLPGVIAGVVALGAAVVGGLAATGVVTRPLGKIFEEKAPEGGAGLVGRTAIVTVEVDAAGGQAEITAQNIILSARCTTGARLPRGAEVVILEYGDDGVYVVEPLGVLLPAPGDGPIVATHSQSEHAQPAAVPAEQKKS